MSRKMTVVQVFQNGFRGIDSTVPPPDTRGREKTEHYFRHDINYKS